MSVVFRTDASPLIGNGHFVRCLALGQAFKARGKRVIFLTSCSNKRLLQSLDQEGFVVHKLEHSYPHPSDWQITRDLLSEYSNALVVLDGYHFDSDYQIRIKEKGHRLMAIDDMGHLLHYYSDVVLNQNIHAEDLNYSCEPYTQFLLGTKYALLRKEFLERRKWKRVIPDIARKILITLGGSDPSNMTCRVITALNEIKVANLEAVVVLGADNPRREVLTSIIRDSELSVRLESNAINMSELMSWADVAVSAAGSTCWELAFMGLPSLLFILADNQREIAVRLDRKGAAINGGPFDSSWENSFINNNMSRLISDAQLRGQMSRCNRDLVDGYGTERVVQHTEALSITLRNVHKDDCRLLWQWVNDPQTRLSSFSQTPISWEEHYNWFLNSLDQKNCYIFIGMDDQKTSIGQVRFNLKDDTEADIDVSVAPDKRGLGYGNQLISLGSREIFRITSLKKIHAFIRPDNNWSIRAFELSNYKSIGPTSVKGHDAIHYALIRNTEQQ